MNFARYWWQAFIGSIILVGVFSLGICSQAEGQDQQGASGGTVSDSAVKKVVPKTKNPGAKAPRPAAKSSNSATKPSAAAAKSSDGPMDPIDGKWWTTGNDFGISQVFFKQNGTIVSGAIMYADGRTGTLSGVMAGKKINYNWTNSSGDRGTGWFEQSWNNFLGGSYRNEKGSSGSWTLSRIAGNWCYRGSSNQVRQVTHNARGQLFFLSDNSGEEVGHLEGPWIFLHGEFGNIKGTMSYKANRVDFATGAYWTWCGRPASP